MPHAVIIGAGISGLTLAWRLQQTMPEADVTVLEKSPRTGGTVWTRERDGFRVEAGPNGFLDSKPSTLELCRELGLAEKLVSQSEIAGKNRFLFVHDKLKRLPGGIGSFLTSDLLSWRGKFGLLSERFRRSRPTNDDESIADFARRRTGKAVELLVDAFVTGIFAGDPHLLSAPACFPRIVNLEREYGSLSRGLAKSAQLRRKEVLSRGETYRRGANMWSFREGMGLLIDKLGSQLKDPPIVDVSAKSVQQSSDEPKQWRVTENGNRSWHADAVVLTCPAHQQSQILAETDRQLAREIGKTPYNRIAVVALGYKTSDVPMSLDGFGFIAPQATRRDILGVQWCSSIFPDRAPDAHVLLRSMCGGWHRPEMVDWDDALLLRAVRSELQIAMGITADPMFSEIVRWDTAIPQYHIGHLERVKKIENRLCDYPGLFLGGNAYRGVALNDCTEQGAILAERVKAYLKQITEHAKHSEYTERG